MGLGAAALRPYYRLPWLHQRGHPGEVTEAVLAQGLTAHRLPAVDLTLSQAELAGLVGVTRQTMSNHLACLRGCGLVVSIPEGRRTRYELTDARIGHALGDLLDLVLVVDPDCCGGEMTTTERLLIDTVTTGEV